MSDHDFKVGDRVIFKPEEVEGFKREIASKIRDRVGVVSCLSYPSGKPVLIFPAIGRKKHFRFGIARSSWLDRAPPEDSP